MRREQLNLRLPPKSFEVLSIAALFEGVSLIEYVKGEIEAKVAQLERDPDIDAVMKLRTHRAAADAPGSNITRLALWGNRDEPA